MKKLHILGILVLLVFSLGGTLSARQRALTPKKSSCTRSSS